MLFPCLIKAANRPSAAAIMEFQESVASEAYKALKKEFADLLKPGSRGP